MHSNPIDITVLTIIDTAKALSLAVLIGLAGMTYYKISATAKVELKTIEAIQVGHPVAQKYLDIIGTRVV